MIRCFLCGCVGRFLSGASWRLVLVRLVVLLSCPFCSTLGQAQSLPTRPDQELLRQLQREQSQREQSLRDRPPVRPDVKNDQATPDAAERLPERLVLDESACYRIDRLRLQGDAADQFQWALEAANFTLDGEPDRALGRCLGERAIEQVIDRVQKHVIKRGYVTTRILAGPQKLSGGTLDLTVMPGYVRRIHVDNARATLWNALPIAPGDLLNLHDIEQGLENLRRLPTVEADIEITPSDSKTAPGDSDLLIHWRQNKPFLFSASVDDSGTRNTGKVIGSLALAWNHLFALNDLLSVSVYRNLGHLGQTADGERGTHSGSFYYGLPLGYSQLEFNHSSSNYSQTVTGLYQSYLYSGESETSDIKFSRLVHRSQQATTSLSAKVWQRSSRNFIEDVEVEVQAQRSAGWELGASHRQFMGRAVLDANLAWRHATGAFHAMAQPNEDESPGISRAQLLRADAQLLLPFKLGEQDLQYSGNFRGQWNRTPLPVLDQFSIGGRFTVRGFDGENMLLGERGWLLRNELALPLRDSQQALYVGLDHGEVGGPSTIWLTGTRLTGAVLGYRGNIQGFNFDFFVGRPLSKPDQLKTAQVTSGFTLAWTY